MFYSVEWRISVLVRLRTIIDLSSAEHVNVNTFLLLFRPVFQVEMGGETWFWTLVDHVLIEILIRQTSEISTGSGESDPMGLWPFWGGVITHTRYRFGPVGDDPHRFGNVWGHLFLFLHRNNYLPRDIACQIQGTKWGFSISSPTRLFKNIFLPSWPSPHREIFGCILYFSSNST